MKIYILMSTHENESTYTLESAHKTERDAQEAEIELQSIKYKEDDDCDNWGDYAGGWQIWIEELELQEDRPKVYTNYETKKIVERMLDDADCYTDAMTYIDDNGLFTAESVREHIEHSPFMHRDTTDADWQQIADALNAEPNHI